jgi:hypothetical protein
VETKFCQNYGEKNQITAKFCQVSSYGQELESIKTGVKDFSAKWLKASKARSTKIPAETPTNRTAIQ